MSTAAIILLLPAWENATDDLVPETGSWVNQHNEVPLLLREGDTFPSCRDGSRGRWTLFIVS